jgi:hypothetical protein
LAILTGDGFTPEQVNGLCQMSANDGMAAGSHAGEDAALPIDDPRCIVAPTARDYRCPGFVAP